MIHFWSNGEVIATGTIDGGEILKVHPKDDANGLGPGRYQITVGPSVSKKEDDAIAPPTTTTPSTIAIPQKFQSVTTSGLAIEIKAEATLIQVNMQGA
ncbi:hypothetical protein [Thalassoroseus pseudoceratinae]|uniref:hypothetical protein n=1 Tax=Thalassoroseus pseudoceratinae TaxID=2713176 RepID=UPI00141F34EA|nr:hypothetical protein [Thalassoroseus pseudoceratinae]